MGDSLDIECTTQIWQEGDQFLADAMPLDVMSLRLPAQEARRAVVEAVWSVAEVRTVTKK